MVFVLNCLSQLSVAIHRENKKNGKKLARLRKLV